MNRLDLDFAPPSLRRTLRLTPWPAWLALALAVLLLAGAAWQARRADGRHAALRADLAALDRSLAERQRRQQEHRLPAFPPARQVALEAVAARLDRPWPALLDAVAAAGHGDVALLELEVEPARQRLHGVAEARDSGAMLAHLERLRRQPALDAVRLVHHERADHEGAHALRYRFDAVWRDAGAGATP